MSDRTMSRTAGGGLGANQIRWLRTNMKPFDDAWKAVQASDAHADRIRARLAGATAGLPGAFGAESGGVQRLRLVERRPRRARGPVTA